MATVFITGTSKGIGLATALAFARAGYKVVAAMRNPKGSSELADTASLEKLSINILSMDVDSDASVQEGMKRVSAEFGPIDVLVNNAGIERTGNVADLQLKDYRTVMETNYFGVIRCTHAVLPEMIQRKSGCIINIASVAGQIASPSMSAYCASKFALEAFSESLATEVKCHGIRVAIVEPGIINTDMARHITDPGSSHYSHQRRLAALFTSSLKRPVSPSLVADKILDIANSNEWKLRHPVGPDAIPFINWRKSMTDEQWIDLAALDDDTWYPKMEADFGMTLPRYEQA
ncbi:MAG: SDR family oxidoreductase [Bacteroidetes bacterium]|nr:SDR family oxidoreductase [Bacteroidota bacterium]